MVTLFGMKGRKAFLENISGIFLSKLCGILIMVLITLTSKERYSFLKGFPKVFEYINIAQMAEALWNIKVHLDIR
jgi:hypothetical protein